MCLFNLFLMYFIYLWLCWVFVAVWAFPSFGELGLLSSYGPQASHWRGFSCCGGLVAPWHVGSSQTRNPTHVSSIGRWIFYHWAIREAPGLCVFITNKTLSNLTIPTCGQCGGMSVLRGPKWTDVMEAPWRLCFGPPVPVDWVPSSVACI